MKKKKEKEKMSQHETIVPLLQPNEMHAYLQATHPHVTMECFSEGLCGQSTDIYALFYVASAMAKDNNLKMVAKACLNLQPKHRSSSEQLLQDLAYVIEMEGKMQVNESYINRTKDKNSYDMEMIPN